jgi:hypothetical protein
MRSAMPCSTAPLVELGDRHGVAFIYGFAFAHRVEETEFKTKDIISFNVQIIGNAVA